MDAHKNPDHELIKNGRESFSGFIITNWFEAIFYWLYFYIENLDHFISSWPAAYDKLYNISKDIMKQREEKGIKSSDFISRMIDLKNQKLQYPNEPSLKYISEDLINAQSVVFFLAGFETTSNTLSTFAYNMTKYPNIQQQVYEEIRRVVDNNNGNIDHETICEMQFLDAVLDENLRLNGPVTVQSRVCTQDCEVIISLIYYWYLTL